MTYYHNTLPKNQHIFPMHDLLTQSGQENEDTKRQSRSNTDLGWTSCHHFLARERPQRYGYLLCYCFSLLSYSPMHVPQWKMGQSINFSDINLFSMTKYINKSLEKKSISTNKKLKELEIFTHAYNLCVCMCVIL